MLAVKCFRPKVLVFLELTFGFELKTLEQVSTQEDAYHSSRDANAPWNTPQARHAVISAVHVMS